MGWKDTYDYVFDPFLVAMRQRLADMRAAEPQRPLPRLAVEKHCPDCEREIYAGCDVDCSRVGCGERR